MLIWRMSKLSHQKWTHPPEVASQLLDFSLVIPGGDVGGNLDLLDESASGSGIFALIGEEQGRSVDLLRRSCVVRACQKSAG
jgi:hypothetical protein